MARNCKYCRYWDVANTPKLVQLVKGKDKVLFAECVNPLIDGVKKEYHDEQTKVLVKSKAKHPLMPHAKFGCRLFKRK